MNSAFAQQNAACTMPNTPEALPVYPPHFVLEYEPNLVEAA